MPIPIGSITNNFAVNGKAIAHNTDTTKMNAGQNYQVISNSGSDTLYVGTRPNITILTTDPVTGSFEYNLGSNPGSDAVGTQLSWSFMYGTTAITSGLLTSLHSFSQSRGLFGMYGVVLPAGRGTWPALWFLSTAGQPEVDMLEAYGGVFGGGGHPAYRQFESLHYATGNQGVYSWLPSDAFSNPHDYEVTIDDNWIAFYVDGKLVNYFANLDTSTGLHIVKSTDQMYFLIDIAVSTLSGGAWTPPDFPQTMKLDAVKAFAPV